MACNVTKPVGRPQGYYHFTLVNSRSHFISRKTAGKILAQLKMHATGGQLQKQQSDFQPVPSRSLPAKVALIPCRIGEGKQQTGECLQTPGLFSCGLPVVLLHLQA